MLISIEHTTRYHYTSEASYSIQSLRLTPCSFEGQRAIDWQIVSHPTGRLTETRDGFGNALHLLTVEGPHRMVEITARGHVEVEDRAGLVRGLAETVPLRVYLRRTALTAPDAAIEALVTPIPPGGTVPWLHDLMARIRGKVEYRTDVTGAETTASEALASGQGVCQDHAHIFIAAARVAGIPARYVTGYLLMEAGPVEPAHHAWAEAWVDGLGWIGFDVANLICPTDRYVRLAAALDATYAAPIRGSRRGGGDESLEVHVQVQQQSPQQ